jgi:hypothetical protein
MALATIADVEARLGQRADSCRGNTQADGLA